MTLSKRCDKSGLCHAQTLGGVSTQLGPVEGRQRKLVWWTESTTQRVLKEDRLYPCTFSKV
jgi:hypothetical protein